MIKAAYNNPVSARKNKGQNGINDEHAPGITVKLMDK